MKSRNDNAKREPEPLRFSRLKLMGKSAAHYAAGYPEETSLMTASILGALDAKKPKGTR